MLLSIIIFHFKLSFSWVDFRAQTIEQVRVEALVSTGYERRLVLEKSWV